MALYYNATIADPDLTNATFLTDANSLGNIVTSEINPAVTYVDHYISDDGKRRKDHNVVNEVTVTIPFTFDEMNAANIKKFFLASLLATDRYAPFELSEQKGCAVLRFTTTVGQDLVYYVPKCTLRPDGPLSINPEDWWTGPMVIDVLYYNENSWASKPYGYMDTSSIA